MGAKLNLGCGRNIMPGWVNVDAAALPGVDVVADLDACRTTPLPFGNDSASEFLLSHVLEHIRDALALMQELHRVAEPGAKLIIRGPYGSSDDAHEDPTHCRLLFANSFAYFSQPTYWRADYGYRGDWETEQIVLFVRKSENEGLTAEEVLRKVNQLRNVVLEVYAVLKAVKPIRPPDRSLQKAATISLQLV